MLDKGIQEIAQDTVDILADISNKAKDALKLSGYSQDVITANSFTDNAFLALETASDSIRRDSLILASEPVFMRVDLEDVDGNYCRSIYISQVAPPGLSVCQTKPINVVSYRAPMGRIASLSPGADFLIKEQD